MKFTLSIRALAALAATALAAASPASAGGIYTVSLKSIPLAGSAIRMDGGISDWPDASVQLAPLDLGVERSDTAAAKALRANPHDAVIHACYDSAALYIGVEQRGAKAVASAPMPLIALNVLTDRMAHVRIAALASGKLTVSIGYDNAPVAKNPLAQAVITVNPDRKSETQIVRLPWSALTITGKLPDDRRVRVALDVAWPDLSPAAVGELPNTVLHHTTFTSLSFLTAPDQGAAPGGYLPHPSQWGTLQFTGAPTPNATSATANESRASLLASVAMPKKPAIDGDLSEWPAERFAKATFLPGYLGDRYSGAIASSWDADNLYLAARVNTGYGIRNNQAEGTKAGYWGGDCLQVRLANGDHLINLCAWYDSVRKKPALTADGNDLTNDFLLAAGAQEAFKIALDGTGYTQEIAIPWTALATKPPTAGQQWKATLQLWWAGLNPQYTAMLDATLEDRGALAYSYTMPFEGNSSVGIYDADGHLLRWLTRAAHRRAGKVTEYWDGLDQYGQPIPAGSYTIRAIAAPPLGMDYKLSVGNPGTPAWPTADDSGDWIGDESSPQACATDGSWVYLASPCAEKGWSIIGLDATGQRRWGFKGDLTPRCVTLAVHGDFLYALYSGPEITGPGNWYRGNNARGRAVLVCLDKRTGKLASFSVAKPQTRVATWPYREDVHWLWDLRSTKSFSPATYAGDPRYSSADIGETDDAIGIAAIGDRIYVSLYYDDKILVLDAGTGTKLDEIPLSKPAGLYGRE